jgi:hypothetical protein
MRVIVVGLGVQGRKRLAAAGAEAVATVDPFHAEAGYARVQDVPLDTYDAALVCTPDEAKLELLTHLLANGKHVLVEKPLFAASSAELDQLKATALRHGAVCYTAYNHRFEPHFVRMKALIDSGRLGRIYSARLFYGNGTARLVRDSAWRDRDAGVLPDLGSHLLDTALFWFGRTDAPFRSGPWKLHFAHPYITVAAEPGRDALRNARLYAASAQARVTAVGCAIATSRANVGPVKIAIAWPGAVAATISLIIAPVPTSMPLVASTIGTDLPSAAAARARVPRKCWAGVANSTMSAFATHAAKLPVAEIAGSSGTSFRNTRLVCCALISATVAASCAHKTGVKPARAAVWASAVPQAPAPITAMVL